MSPVQSVPAVGETNGIFSLPTVLLLVPCLLTFLVSSLYSLAATLQNGTHSRCHAGPISHRSIVRFHLFHIVGSKSVALVILDALSLWHTSTFNRAGWDHTFPRAYCYACMWAFFNLPPGIISERAPADTDFGTFARAPVFSAALSGRREVVWVLWSAGVWLLLSGLSRPSPLGVSWSRCSEKLPDYCKKCEVRRWDTQLHHKLWLYFFVCGNQLYRNINYIKYKIVSKRSFIYILKFSTDW